MLYSTTWIGIKWSFYYNITPSVHTTAVNILIIWFHIPYCIHWIRWLTKYIWFHFVYVHICSHHLTTHPWSKVHNLLAVLMQSRPWRNKPKIIKLILKPTISILCDCVIIDEWKRHIMGIGKFSGPKDEKLLVRVNRR